MKLNVGCGCDSWGDIRTDLDRYSFRYRKRTTANILADVHHLPFRDKIFLETRCFHVLEHVQDPKKAFNELKRVSEGLIIIRVPVWHFYSLLIEALYLLYYFALMPLFGIEEFRRLLNEVKRWKERYSDHKWYIKFKKAKENKEWLLLPREYEFRWTQSKS